MQELGQLRRPIEDMPEDEESDEVMASGPDSGGVAFRISVDLSEYFQQPARCFLWVPRPRDSRTVRWLARRLRRSAALRERFCLLCASHTLPPDEPLSLLRPGDSLCVVRVEHDWQRVFSFRGERLPPAPPPKPKKRRKTDTVEAEPPPNPLVSKLNPTPEPLPSPQPKPPSAVSLPLLQLTLPPSAQFKPTQALFIPKSVPTPPSALPTTSPAPRIIKPPSQDEELQRVKRRALALLQKVEGNISPLGQEGGADEPDGGDEWQPAKKRRRRVRRRRPLPPIDFEQEMGLPTTQSPATAEAAALVLSAAPKQSHTQAPPSTPKLSHTQAPPSTPEAYLTPAVSATPATSIPMSSILAPPSIPLPSLSLAPPPGPVVVRGAMTPRPPRVVRALDAAQTDDVNQPPIEHNASAASSLLPQTAVQCS